MPDFVLLPFYYLLTVSLRFITLCYLSLPYLTLRYLSLPCRTLPFATFPYPTLPFCTLGLPSYLSLPFRTLPLPYATFPYLPFVYFFLTRTVHVAKSFLSQGTDVTTQALELCEKWALKHYRRVLIAVSLFLWRVELFPGPSLLLYMHVYTCTCI